MNIRAITPDDIPACVRLFIKTYNQPPWRYQWSPEKAEKYLIEYMESKQFVGFVVPEGEEMAAAIFSHTKTWWTKDQLYVDELFVSPDKQRSGHGKALLEHTATWCRENGFPTIFLMTNKFMPAFKFYNKHDFSLAEHFVFFFKEA